MTPNVFQGKRSRYSIVVAIIFFFFNSIRAVDILLDQKILMQDGVSLSGNVYKPEDQSNKLPVILTVTPYGMDEMHKYGMYFAKNDYVYVVVDSRGRGNSEGEFIPFVNEGKDGYSIIDWISKQEFCNGKVGMMGGSYRGMVQWLAMKHLPSALKTIVPTASVGTGIDFPMEDNIFTTYAIRWLTYVSGKSRNKELFLSSFWKKKFEKAYERNIPFEELDEFILGKKNPVFQDWIKHPSFDDYWRNIMPIEDEFAEISIPILTITGYFDSDQSGALYYYENHLKNSKAKEHHLLIGPWSHSGTRKPKSSLGGFEFGDDSVIDMMQLHKDWFDWKLKNGLRPELIKSDINYFELGSNQWKCRLLEKADSLKM